VAPAGGVAGGLLSALLSLYRRYGVLERAGFFGLSVAVRCVEIPS
jgi:hypothetical protein